MSIEELLEEESKKRMDGNKEPYVLKLFIAGISSKSQRAIENLKKLCAEYKLDCNLEIIDIYQNPIIAKNGQILAAPTLIKELPLPVRKFIGDMSDRNRLILGLDIKTKEIEKERSVE